MRIKSCIPFPAVVQMRAYAHTCTPAVLSHVGTGNTRINSPRLVVLIQDGINVVGKVSKASNTPKI